MCAYCTEQRSKNYRKQARFHQPHQDFIRKLKTNFIKRLTKNVNKSQFKLNYYKCNIF